MVDRLLKRDSKDRPTVEELLSEPICVQKAEELVSADPVDLLGGPQYLRRSLLSKPIVLFGPRQLNSPCSLVTVGFQGITLPEASIKLARARKEGMV